MLASRGSRDPLRMLDRTRWVGRSVLVVLVAAAMSSMSRAESTSDTTAIRVPSDPMPSSLRTEACEGRTIRVRLGARTLVCRAPEFTPAGIVPVEIAPTSGSGGPGYHPPAPLPWRDIERIEVRGNSAATGATIGAVTCGLLGLAIGGAIAADPFLGSGFSGGNMVLIIGTTAVGGAGAGALVGWALPRWKVVYRRGARRDSSDGRPGGGHE
jgi:hypothetical protein